MVDKERMSIKGGCGGVNNTGTRWEGTAWETGKDRIEGPGTLDKYCSAGPVETSLSIAPLYQPSPTWVGCYRDIPSPPMRLSPTTSLALVGLLGTAIAHESPVTRRKTMGFGPVHPHARFHTGPISSAKASFLNSNPYEVAGDFVKALLKEQHSGDNGFALRKDSYTDKATGITHVFYRQIINGIEVVDGDMNVNVKNGAVISHGDSVSTVGGPPLLAGCLFYCPSFTMAVCPAS